MFFSWLVSNPLVARILREKLNVRYMRALLFLFLFLFLYFLNENRLFYYLNEFKSLIVDF
jgi:hypothetical protein